MNKRLEELIEKEILTIEELEELELMEEVVEVQDNGMSGTHVGYHWYTVVTNEDEYTEYEVYTK